MTQITPPISLPPSPPPTRATQAQNGPVTESSPSPSRSGNCTFSEKDQAIVNAYGVWVEKSMYGKKYMGTERSTFVIGPDGKLKAILPKVNPMEHLDQLLAALE